MIGYQTHPAAGIFPLMKGVEFDALVKDIREHGQCEPIVLHDGMILDGRNRWRACVEIGVDPIVENWNANGSAQAFVISKNLHRRHLNESQRGMIGATLATLKTGDVKSQISGDQIRSPSIRNAADMMNVSKTLVIEAKYVLKEGTPEEIDDAEQGKLVVSTMAKKIRSRQKGTAPPSLSSNKTGGGKVKIPGGKTLEEICREGLALEASGMKPEHAAKNVGLEINAYRAARYIVLLVDRSDLSAGDQQTAATALSYMNERQQVGPPYETVLPLVERIWGKGHQRTGERGAQNRIKKFDLSLGAIIQSCVAATDIDVPHLNEQRATEIVGELRRAVECLRILQHKVEDLHR